MNKDFFFPKIKIFKKKYYGYIWPTDNWVEVHCFGNKKQKEEFTTAEQLWSKNETINVNGIRSPITMKLFHSTNTYFLDRTKSFIISRGKVSGNEDLIECQPEKEDYIRWKEWHPKDNFLSFFEGKDKEWYFGETHAGSTFARKILKNNQLGELKFIDDEKIKN